MTEGLILVLANVNLLIGICLICLILLPPSAGRLSSVQRSFLASANNFPLIALSGCTFLRIYGILICQTKYILVCSYS